MRNQRRPKQQKEIKSMNKPNIKQQLRRAFFPLAIVGALTVGAVFTLPKADAGSYGPGALYQIEFVTGDNGASYAPVGQRGAAAALNGGGQWLWFALYPNGDADYAGTDCLSALGSFPDSSRVTGDAHWEYVPNGSIPDSTPAYTGPVLVISNVVLDGFKFLSNLVGCPNTCVPPAPGQPDQVYFCYTSTTITVPAAYGHYTGTDGTFEQVPKILVNCVEIDGIDPNGGVSRVQVAGGAPGTKP
jgi:hypothetical protein